MSQQILNLDELSTLEHRYAGILGAGELMRRAGDAVARVIESRIAKPAHVVIVCGPGNGLPRDLRDRHRGCPQNR